MGTPTTEGEVTVWKQSIRGVALNKPFRMKLPHNARLIKVGIEPGKGTPAFWYLLDPGNDVDPEEERYFVVAYTGHVLKAPATHHGMWWEAADVYHLFELHSDPSLLINVLAGDE